MANTTVNKVVLGNETLLDLTADTVTPQTLYLGTTAHDASGAAIVGTMSGGGTEAGTVTQDADGYLVLSDQGGDTPTPSGGLEYEMGTFTPSEDVSTYIIAFTNTHTSAPFYYMISDATGTYSDTINSSYWLLYCNHHQLFGAATYESTSMIHYGEMRTTNRSSSATSFTNGTISITYPYTYEGTTSTSESRYWATETSIKAYTNSSSRYWRTGRTYKWIAVWAPTS